MRFLLARLVAALVIGSVATAANAEWYKAISNHFIIYSDQDPGKLADYANRLEKFDQAVRFARGASNMLPGPANKLTIFAVKDIAAIQDLYGGSGAAGFYINRAGSSVAFVPMNYARADRTDLSADIIFFHEYAHHLMYQDLRAALPSWLVEGFAEFFSTVRFEPDGAVGIGAPAAHRAEILLMKLASPMPLDKMLESNIRGLRHYYTEEVYGRGWLLTHYLMFNPARKGQLERYVAGIQTGKPALQSAKEAFGDLGRLNGELAKYVRSTRFPYVAVPASKLQTGPVSVQRLGVGEAAMMPVKMQSQSGVSEDEAIRLVGPARQIAARYPTDAAVQTALAEAELDAENFDQAVAAADRALTAAPRSIDALLYKARALAEKAEKDKTGDWKAIQSIFLAANKLDPEDPRPLIGYYSTFGTAGLRPTKDAAAGLFYALELAPHDSDVRKLVVRELVAQGRGPEAASTLRPLAYNPHGGKSVDRAEGILAAIEAGNMPDALKLIDEAERAEEEEIEKAKKKKRG